MGLGNLPWGWPMINLNYWDVKMQTLQGGTYDVDEGTNTGTKSRVGCSWVCCGPQGLSKSWSKMGRVKALDTEVGNIGMYSLNNWRKLKFCQHD